MSSSSSVLTRIAADLNKGTVPLAHLGEAPAAAQHAPGHPGGDGAVRYMMNPQIRMALDRNRRLENLYLVFLVAFFVIACGLSIAAHLSGWGWKASAAVIPGLGATSVWPIRRLAELRQANIELEMLPVLLPILSLEAAREVVLKMLRTRKNSP